MTRCRHARTRLSQFKEECKADCCEINERVNEAQTHNESNIKIASGDDAFVEDCRMPGYSKHYIYEADSWKFIGRVITSVASAKICRKRECVQTSIDLLRSGDITGSAEIIKNWIETEAQFPEMCKEVPLKTSNVYNSFISKTLREVAVTRSDICTKDRMRLAMIMWKEFKSQTT